MLIDQNEYFMNCNKDRTFFKELVLATAPTLAAIVLEKVLGEVAFFFRAKFFGQPEEDGTGAEDGTENEKEVSASTTDNNE